MPSRLWPHPTPRAAVSLAFSISPASVRGSLHRFLVFVHIPYTTQSGSSQPGRPRRTCGGDTILPFASAVGKLARRSAPEDVQGRPRNLWFAVHHAFRIHGYRTGHIFIGQRGRVSAAHG